MFCLKSIISYAKSYGFIFPSSEIYEGLNSIYDYAYHGVLLKNNIKNYWWKSIVQLNTDIIGIDSSILTHEKVWQASGHLNYFNDFIIINKDSKLQYRIDCLIEDFIYKNNILNKDLIINTMKYYMSKEDCKSLKSMIKGLSIYEPRTKSLNWGDVYIYNLMFKTPFDNINDKLNNKFVYLRPETAQGIFINFSNFQKKFRCKIPFGVAQIGKSFRNEFMARQFIFRMKEFEQMEMQFFINPNYENYWFNYWKKMRLKWHLLLNFDEELYRLKDHDNLSHYCSKATDIEFCFPFGFKELEGIHSRRDFDLKNHEIFSKKKNKYFNFHDNVHYHPYVIETSVGLDRIFFAILCSSLYSEKLLKKKLNTKNTDNMRLVLKLPSFLAPFKASIHPLVKKESIINMSKDIMNTLKLYFNISYEDKNSIGKRYRRQDAIGTPLNITVDYNSLNDNTVTIRYRDSMNQARVHVDQLYKIIKKETTMVDVLKKMSL